jgi:hypothetical protein
MATVAMPMAAMAEAAPVRGRSRQENPLEKILNRYGSELGNVKRTGR